MSEKCVLCGNDGDEFYGYIICEDCKGAMRLFSDKTIKRHSAEYPVKHGHPYAEEVERHLALLDKDHIRKKIKLLHIQDRIREMQTE